MSTDLVTVAVLDNPEQAAMARNVLDAAGIPCFLADENMVGMAWHMAGAVGGIKLQVSTEDEEDARALLDKDETLGPITDFEAGHPPFRGIDLRHATAAGFPSVGPKSRDADDDEEDPAPTTREKNALASLRMAVLGLIFAPILLLALYMLFHIVGSEERLEGKARRHAWITAAILGAVLLLLMLIISIPKAAP